MIKFLFKIKMINNIKKFIIFKKNFIMKINYYKIKKNMLNKFH